jgi:hypothetical protein
VWQQQCGRSGSVAAAAVWRRQPGSIGVTVSAWRCDSSGRAAVVWHRQRTSSRGGPMWRERCGSSGVAAAAVGSSWAEPAGDDQSGGRACVRAGAQTWRAHLRGRQRGRSERASGRWRAFFEFTNLFFCLRKTLALLRPTCVIRYIPDPSLKRQTPRATGSPNLATWLPGQPFRPTVRMPFAPRREPPRAQISTK